MPPILFPLGGDNPGGPQTGVAPHRGMLAPPVVTAYPCQGLYAGQVIADKPVVYFRLGESSGTSAADQMGGGSGFLSAGQTWGLPGALAGDSDTALRLANSAFVDIAGASYPLTNASRSTEAWVRTKTLALGPIVFYGTAAGSQWWRMAVASDGSLQLSLFGTDLAFGVAGQLTDDQWHHVVCTYDGTNVRAYVDGAEAAGSPQAASPNTVASNAWIGTDGSNFIAGSIDEVAIYSRALSAESILVHYQLGACGFVSKPSAAYGAIELASGLPTWTLGPDDDQAGVIAANLVAGFDPSPYADLLATPEGGFPWPAWADYPPADGADWPPVLPSEIAGWAIAAQPEPLGQSWPLGLVAADPDVVGPTPPVDQQSAAATAETPQAAGPWAALALGETQPWPEQLPAEIPAWATAAQPAETPAATAPFSGWGPDDDQALQGIASQVFDPAPYADQYATPEGGRTWNPWLVADAGEWPPVFPAEIIGWAAAAQPIELAPAWPAWALGPDVEQTLSPAVGTESAAAWGMDLLAQPWPAWGLGPDVEQPVSPAVGTNSAAAWAIDTTAILWLPWMDADGGSWDAYAALPTGPVVSGGYPPVGAAASFTPGARAGHLVPGGSAAALRSTGTAGHLVPRGNATDLTPKE